MPKDLTTTGKQSMSLAIDWSDPQMQLQIKETYGAKLNEPEWKMFLAMGQVTRLNPFLKEIWAVKYGTAPASIFIGRDGYRKSAQAHPEYDYHESNAVYSNDEFEINTIDGTVTHKIGKDRDEVVGAYCIVKRKSASRPVVTYIDRKEYDKKQSVWKDMPATMCKKVAEAQGLRASFQELFAGTYDEAEEVKVPQQIIDIPTITADQLIAKLESARSEEAYNIIVEEVQNEMGSLSASEREKVMTKGKELRKKFTKPAVTEADVIDAEVAMKQEPLPVE